MKDFARLCEIESSAERMAVCQIRLNVPVLILHSRTDKMVPVTQALRMAEALQEKGKVYSLHVYERDGHPLLRNREDRDRLIVDWFNRIGQGNQ